MLADDDIPESVRRAFADSAQWTDAQLTNNWRLTAGLDPLPEAEAAAISRAARAKKVRRIRKELDNADR